MRLLLDNSFDLFFTAFYPSDDFFALQLLEREDLVELTLQLLHEVFLVVFVPRPVLW